MHGMRTVSHGPQEKSGLNKRIEDIGWGLLLVLTGGVLLVPDERIPQGSWLIGAGVILLGLNLVRSLNGIAINWFSAIMGIFALIAGAGEYYGIDLPLLPLFLIVIGASLVVRPLREAR